MDQPTTSPAPINSGPTPVQATASHQTPPGASTAPNASPAGEEFGKVRRFPWMRWTLAALITLFLTAFHLLIDFRGLSEPAGMEMAQAAREFARGDGLKTKMHRPLVLAERAEENGGVAPNLSTEKSVHHGPLGPLVNGTAMRLSGWDYQADGKYRVYFPDRAIAAVATLCFLGAVAITFLLASRWFDTRVAVATALTLLLSELMWRFTQSGLPQMLGMLLLMLALWALSASLERWRTGRVPLLPLLGAAVCLGLLPLALPATLGLTAGGLGFVFWMFHKRILVPILFAALCGAVILPWLLWNLNAGDSLFGSSGFEIHESPAETAGSRLMRTYEPGSETLPTVDLGRKMKGVIRQHLDHFWSYIGSSIAAPLFFLALLHPFRNPEAARLKWGIFLMWAGAGIAMSLLGTPGGRLDPNQLHVLFVPAAAAFGLALLSVLWARVPLAQNPFSLWRNAHLIAAVALSALPFLFELPRRALDGAQFRNRVIHWPPYDPAAVSHLKMWTEPDSLIFSDIPWAVAWYADRQSIWLPTEPHQLEILTNAWKDAGGSYGGIYLTPQSLNGRISTDVMNGDFREWSRILMRSPVMRFDHDLFDKLPPPIRLWRRLSPTRNDEAWFISAMPTTG